MAEWTGVEPATFAVTVRCSSQLNYRPTIRFNVKRRSTIHNTVYTVNQTVVLQYSYGFHESNQSGIE